MAEALEEQSDVADIEQLELDVHLVMDNYASHKIPAVRRWLAGHLPLYRQHRMLAGAGITVNRGSLSLWANRAIALLKPIHDAHWRSVLRSAVIQMDETPIRAGRHPGKPGGMKKGYFWPVLGDRGEVVFPFAGSRRHRHAAKFLGDYAGTLVSDGYGVYQAYVAARNPRCSNPTPTTSDAGTAKAPNRSPCALAIRR